MSLDKRVLTRHVGNKHLRKWVDRRSGWEEVKEVPSYSRLMSHMPYHNIRDWFLRGAKDEDAVTIGCAFARLSDGELERGLARLLSRERRRRS